MNICGTSIDHFGPLYKYFNMTSALSMAEVVWAEVAVAKNNTSLKINLFHDFVVLCSFCDFGPCDFNNEKDRSYV